MPLEDYIKNEIRHNGPMSIATFMELAVAHYYNSRDPFGTQGDFTTAPEISQMFGEMIGAWAADCWMKMGGPSPFALVECGPGRGTLMADALRATKAAPGFHAAAKIQLVETSETLRARQKEALAGFEVQWHERLDSVPETMPVILLANEFLDALPVRQFMCQDGEWRERMVGVDERGELCFGLSPEAIPHPAPAKAQAPKLPQPSPLRKGGGKGGGQAVWEVSPARRGFVESVCTRVQRQGGAALFIDYGYMQGQGDTLQALKKHEFCDVLHQVGEADLTAHVDFGALSDMDGVAVHGPVTQGTFLQRLGMAQRAAMLKQNATAAQCEAIDAAYARLTGAKEMGDLFKVIAYSSDGLAPEGF